MSITITAHDQKARWVSCIIRHVVESTVHSVSIVDNVIQKTSSKSLSSFDIEHRRAVSGRLRLKCDGTRTETGFRLSPKGTIPFKSVGASVQSTAGNRGVRISGSNAGYTMFRLSVKSTGYPLHSPLSPSLPLPCITVYHHISTGHCSCLVFEMSLVHISACRRAITFEASHGFTQTF
jgi:hypothetical protein